MSQRDVKNRISSVQNIRKITRAMEMVAAARLRRAEQRIERLRPYAGAIRRMTRQAAQAAGAEIASMPILQQRDSQDRVAILLVTADRGLAGAFNSQIIRAGLRAASELEAEGRQVVFYASGRRGVSSLTFRGREVAGGFVGFTDRPAFSDARDVAEALMAAYVDGAVDRVDVFYNGYVSALTQEVRRETLLPLQQATVLEGGRASRAVGHGAAEAEQEEAHEEGHGHALVDYEPDPAEILQRLVPDYVEISIFRALLESTASEHGARMTAMRNASENAAEVIEDLTLEMNRARQAEITQEIMEVVAGAESLV
ncbi:MAG TPA: ATP synthase F1 subunit gamma [Solirubrobacteraceae bacterium]|nr:ATP synthase F1 subunit gamma [Solirubrobacteraceae bacterium]